MYSTHRLLAWLGVVLALLAGLTACSGGGDAPVDLPLAADGPTLFFFYTDN